MTKILSVEERATMFKEFYCECNGSMTSDAIYATTHRIITEDRNQAYTRLVEGIAGMTYAINVDEYLELVGKWDGKNYDQPFDDGYAQALKDIREKVVKPLYGKE